MKVNVEQMNCDSISDSDLESYYLIPHYDFHITPDWGLITPPNKAKRWLETTDVGIFRSYRKHSYSKYNVLLSPRHLKQVNDVAKYIFKSIDGKSTCLDIYKKVLGTYNQPFGTKQASVYSFMKDAIKKGICSLSSTPQFTPVKQTGSEEYYYPVHFSLEVTAKCNLRCIHCYGAFENNREDEWPEDKLIDLIDTLSENGACVVELTGGECTIHPNFSRILSHCFEKMDVVCILTNGVALTDETCDIIIHHADRVFLQICINGTEDYHNKFTQSKTAYKRATTTIRKLASQGVGIATAMNLTLDNCDMIEHVALNCLELGASFFQVGLVLPVGRAKDNLPFEPPKGCTPSCQRTNMDLAETNCETVKILKRVNTTMEQLIKRFPNYVRRPRYEAIEDKSCGAVNRTIYISSNGKIGICPMHPSSEVPALGDFNKQSLQEIVSSDVWSLMANLPAPNIEDCENCPHQTRCAKCIMAGLRRNVKTADKCEWAKKYNLSKLLDSRGDTLIANPELKSCS